MKKSLILFASFCLCIQLHAQEVKNAGKKSNVEGHYLGFGIPISDDIELQPELSHIVSENESSNSKALENIKEMKMLLKKAHQNDAVEEPQSKNKTRGFDPTLVAGYNALGSQGTPPDNSVAVNKNGQLIAIVNSSMRTYNTTTGAGVGAISSLSNFFATPSNGTLLTTDICDPKVFYDPESDRFIVFSQTCAGNSSSSQLLLAFSKNSDPTLGWYFYAFTGNPSSVATNVWFDYPKMGVSNADVFVTGNCFDDNFNYVESIIYQIDKKKCYAGNTLVTGDAIVWTSISNNPFTIVPASNGQTGGYGNNMYLITNNQSFSGNNLLVYEVTNSVHNSPQLNLQIVGIASYSPAANAEQKGTAITLNNGDARGMDAFYLNGTLHFVFHCDVSNGFTGINYNRLKKVSSNWQLTNHKLIGISNVDCAYPSIASMGWDANDQGTIIGFNYSSANFFPGMKAIFVDNGFNSSNPIEIKTGTGYVNIGASGGDTRWGDYSGMTRVLNASIPTSWFFGMYGNTSHGWTNHFAKITTTSWPTATTEIAAPNDDVKVFPNPIEEDIYTIKLQLKESGMLEIKILDLNGRVIKNLYKSSSKIGENVFSFNKGALASGNYILNFSLNNHNIKNEKITVLTK